MNSIINQPTSIVLNLLKLTPILGIALIALCYTFNALSGTGIFLVVSLVSALSAVLIVIEESDKSDDTSLIIQFFISLNVWFILYPIYFYQKELRENKGNFSLLACLLVFILIIGSGEMYRFGMLKSASDYLSGIAVLCLAILTAIIIYSAPIIFANVFNSVKKSSSILYALLSIAVILISEILGLETFFRVGTGILSLILYYFSLRMAFYKLPSN